MRNEINPEGKYSFSRFKKVMNRPPLNTSEAFGVGMGVMSSVGGVVEGGYFGGLLTAMEDQDVIMGVVQGATLGGAAGAFMSGAFILPMAVNRGWGQEDINRDSTLSEHSETTSNQIKSYLRESWKRMAFRTGSFVVPLASAQAGLWIGANGGDYNVAFALTFGGTIGIGILPAVTDSVIGIKKRK